MRDHRAYPRAADAATEQRAGQSLAMAEVWGCYVRVSDPRQVTEGVSIDAQTDELKAWALVHGYESHFFRDEGVSAWTDELDKRPAFKTMLEAVERGEIAGIAATHVDRMARDDYLLAHARRVCRKMGPASSRSTIHPLIPCSQPLWAQ